MDLYLYYALIGLGMSSPPLRAACIAMMSVIAARNPELVVGTVDQLVSLRGDKWWEVRAQLLIVCSTLLQRLTPAVCVCVCVCTMMSPCTSSRSST